MTDGSGREALGLILKRLVGNAGLLLAGRGANAVLGLASLALASRALGAANMGVLVLVQAFAQLVGEMIRFQSWQSVLQYGAAPLADGRRADLQRVVKFALTLDALSAVAGLLVGMAGAWLFAGRLGWGGAHAPAAVLYMLCILTITPSAPIGLMRLLDRFDVLARQTALVSLVRLIGAGIALGLKAPLEGFLLAWAAGHFIGFGYLAAVTLRTLHARDLLAGFDWRGPPGGGLPGAWRFAWNTNLAATLDVGMTHAATLVVGALLGPAPAAFWRIGRQVADAIAKPARLLAPALYPELARLNASGDRSMMTRLAVRVGLTSGALGLVLLALSAAAGPALLTLVMGAAFAPAAAVMTWQVAAVVVGVCALPLEPMLMSLGRPGAVAAVQGAVSAAFIAALFVVIPRLGLTGAGAALLLAEIVLALGLLGLLRRVAKSG